MGCTGSANKVLEVHRTRCDEALKRLVSQQSRKVECRPKDTISQTVSSSTILSNIIITAPYASTYQQRRRTEVDDRSSNVPTISESIADMQDFDGICCTNFVATVSSFAALEQIPPLSSIVDDRDHPLAPISHIPSDGWSAVNSEVVSGDLGCCSEVPSSCTSEDIILYMSSISGDEGCLGASVTSRPPCEAAAALTPAAAALELYCQKKPACSLKDVHAAVKADEAHEASPAVMMEIRNRHQTRTSSPLARRSLRTRGCSGG